MNGFLDDALKNSLEHSVAFQVSEIVYEIIEAAGQFLRLKAYQKLNMDSFHLIHLPSATIFSFLTNREASLEAISL